METVRLTELSSLGEDNHLKTRRASTNIDLVVRKFLRINKAFQSIQHEQANNTSKLTEINRHIKKR